MKNLIDRIYSRFNSNWRTFSYNFHWEKYSALFDGNLQKSSVLIPLFGYLIIFNDTAVSFIEFEKLTSSTKNFEFFSTISRLRLIYFGLVLIGVSQLIYIFRRPHVIRFGSTFWDYKEKILSLASPSVFIQINGEIRNVDYVPWTQGGKYYDREYEDFLEMCTGSRPGSSLKDAYENRKAADWNGAIKRYEPLVTGMLEENYFNHGRTRRIALSLALFFALFGLALLSIPSVELFLRVVLAMVT